MLANYEFRCDGCLKVKRRAVKVNHSAPNFCTDQCKKSSKKAKAILKPLPCPRPDKRAWENNEIGGRRAHTKATKMRLELGWKPEDNSCIKIYLCRCNQIHIGNFAYKFIGYIE